MPSGVEHLVAHLMSKPTEAVRIPLMPSGVEHDILGKTEVVSAA